MLDAGRSWLAATYVWARGDRSPTDPLGACTRSAPGAGCAMHSRSSVLAEDSSIVHYGSELVCELDVSTSNELGQDERRPAWLEPVLAGEAVRVRTGCHATGWGSARGDTRRLVGERRYWGSGGVRAKIGRKWRAFLTPSALLLGQRVFLSHTHTHTHTSERASSRPVSLCDALARVHQLARVHLGRRFCAPETPHRLTRQRQHIHNFLVCRW